MTNLDIIFEILDSRLVETREDEHFEIEESLTDFELEPITFEPYDN
jgi:hypothetical protein